MISESMEMESRKEMELRQLAMDHQAVVEREEEEPGQGEEATLDWRGRPSNPNKHGGMRAASFALGIYAHIYNFTNKFISLSTQYNLFHSRPEKFPDQPMCMDWTCMVFSPLSRVYTAYRLLPGLVTRGSNHATLGI